jgi:hypothetical protein
LLDNSNTSTQESYKASTCFPYRRGGSLQGALLRFVGRRFGHSVAALLSIDRSPGLVFLSRPSKDLLRLVWGDISCGCYLCAGPLI